MDTELILTIIIAVIGSNALFGFFQFLLERKDKKEDKKEDCSQKILKAIEVLTAKVDKLDGELSERTAIACRIRILKFMDELLEGRGHTKDSYDQCMGDITDYENYCDVHPTFKNNQTGATIEYIKKSYQERLDKHDFL